MCNFVFIAKSLKRLRNNGALLCLATSLPTTHFFNTHMSMRRLILICSYFMIHDQLKQFGIIKQQNKHQ